MIPFLVVQQARCTTGPLCQERAKLTYVVFFDTKCDFFFGGAGGYYGGTVTFVTRPWCLCFLFFMIFEVRIFRFSLVQKQCYICVQTC